MLKLLKHELSYRKDQFFSVFLGAVIISLLLLNWDTFDKNYQPGGKIGLFLLLYFFFAWVAMLFNNTRIKENRERLISLLPLSMRERALSRVLVELMTWLILVLLFLLFYLIWNREWDLLLFQAIAATSGVGFGIYGLGFFFTDLLMPAPATGNNKIPDKIVTTLLKSIVPFLAFFLGIIQTIAVIHIFNHSNDLYNRIYQTGVGSTLLLVLGLVFLGCTVIFYEKRSGYTEER